MARLAQINGVTVSEIIKDLPDADRWSYTREQRLTYDNRLIRLIWFRARLVT